MLLTLTDVSTSRALNFSSVDRIGQLSLVVCQLSRDVIGYEDFKCHWRASIALLSWKSPGTLK